MAYYKKIKGKNYDRDLLEKADSLTQGKGDGRISLKDAKTILGVVKDSDTYSDVEKGTMKYIRDHYKFTPEADTWFRTEIRKWAASGNKAAVKPAKKAAPVKKATPKKTAPLKKTAKQPATKPVTQKKQPAPQASSYTPAPTAREAADETGKKGSPVIKIILVLLLILFIGFIIIKIQNSGCVAPDAKDAKKMQAVSDKKDATTAQKQETAGPGEYIVEPKDSLISISEKKTGDYNNWKKIYDANQDKIKRPSQIFSGQKLKIPK